MKLLGNLTPVMLLAALALLPARGGTLLLSVEPVLATPGSTGDNFDVLIQNQTAGTVDISGFSFEVDTVNTAVTFTGTTFNTVTGTYIFAGNSLFGPNLNLNAPGQAMDGEDLAAAPGSFTALAPNEILALGNVSFDVAGNAVPGSTAAVTINSAPALTSITDNNGDSLAFSLLSGSVTIVPEPGTFWGAGLALVVWMRWLASARRRRTTSRCDGGNWAS
jgi:hypothetical protein